MRVAWCHAIMGWLSGRMWWRLKYIHICTYTYSLTQSHTNTHTFVHICIMKVAPSRIIIIYARDARNRHTRATIADSRYGGELESEDWFRMTSVLPHIIILIQAGWLLEWGHRGCWLTAESAGSSSTQDISFTSDKSSSRFIFFWAHPMVGFVRVCVRVCLR